MVVSFRHSVIILSYGVLKSQVVEDFGDKIALFEKGTPLQGNLQNSLPKGVTTSPIHVLCAIFMEFGRLEISTRTHQEMR